MANSQTLSIARSVLSQELEWTQPIFLIGSAIKGNTEFRNTHWAAPTVPEEEAR